MNSFAVILCLYSKETVQFLCAIRFGGVCLDGVNEVLRARKRWRVSSFNALNSYPRRPHMVNDLKGQISDHWGQVRLNKLLKMEFLLSSSRARARISAVIWSQKAIRRISAPETNESPQPNRRTRRLVRPGETLRDVQFEYCCKHCCTAPALWMYTVNVSRSQSSKDRSCGDLIAETKERDVISGANVAQIGMDVPVKLGDSGSNCSRDIRLPHFVRTTTPTTTTTQADGPFNNGENPHTHTHTAECATQWH